MKKLLDFSSLYKQNYSISKNFVILPCIIICILLGQELFLKEIDKGFSFSSYLYFTVFFIIHLYCSYASKHIPYEFIYFNWYDILFLRALPAFLFIFESSDFDSVYFLILFIIWYLFLQNIYKKYFFEIVRENSNVRFPRIETKGKIIHGISGKCAFYYTERVILLLSFLLPFQDFIPIEIKKFSIFIFSFNAFILLLLIPSLRDLVSNIFHRLKKALFIFCGMAFFILILTVQLHNLYNIDYPQYFSDIPTTLKTLTLIIVGESFSDLPTTNSELYILFFGIFCFIGIILLSFFTAYLVDNEEPNNASRKASNGDKILLGKIDGKLVFVKSIIANKSSEIIYTILYNNKEFICDEKHKYYDLKWKKMTDNFDIFDAFIVIHNPTTN